MPLQIQKWNLQPAPPTYTLKKNSRKKVSDNMKIYNFAAEKID